MKISVITWDGNFREYTHTIDFFANQEFDKNEYEFIWVDFYNSNDRVRQKIENYPNTRLITLGNSPDTLWHIGKCINEGVKNSSGELLVIPDGDIVVELDFLTYVWNAHQKCQDMALYFHRYDEPSEPGSKKDRVLMPHLRKHSKLLNPVNYAGSLSLRRINFDKINGYETHKTFAGPGVIGRDAYIRLCNLGMAIKWAPDKNVYHPWHPSSGSAGHDDRKALWLAVSKHKWIIPYAGLEQSWIIRCRALSGDTVADETLCDKYIARMDKVDMQFYRRLAKLLSSRLMESVIHQLSK